MTRELLETLASTGAVIEIATMEQQLLKLHRRWPALFVNRAKPVLLAASKKPHTNGNGNGHWPPLLKTHTPRTKRSAARALVHKAAPAKRGAFSDSLVAVVAKHPKGISVADVARTMPGRDKNLVNVSLATLTTRGRLRRVGKGIYAPA